MSRANGVTTAVWCDRQEGAGLRVSGHVIPHPPLRNSPPWGVSGRGLGCCSGSLRSGAPSGALEGA